MFAHYHRTFIITLIVLAVFYIGIPAEPIVLSGAMVPGLVGTPISHLRVINSKGVAVPFQVDEITAQGEYVCPQGEEPNADSGCGMLKKQDEIVFLLEDADSGAVLDERYRHHGDTNRCVGIKLSHGQDTRHVWVADDAALSFSNVSYCAYDHTTEYLQTPYYYAQFCRDRFHFRRAGPRDFTKGDYVDLTNELRVEITLKMLWGLIPIRYTEESMVCHVKRYKAGPVRLIRRGDFYLKLGFGLKGSKAVVYQMCYPQVVKVPVKVHLPVRFKSFFSEAYIEMTPVISRKVAHEGFRFSVPNVGYSCGLCTATYLDTLVRGVPDKEYIVSDGRKGYGWITTVGVDPALLAGSGYVVRRPSKRGGIAECGFRLTVRDLPKGSYDIVNWVFFSKTGLEEHGGFPATMSEPTAVATPSGSYVNLLGAK